MLVAWVSYPCQDRGTTRRVPQKMNNNWNEADAPRQIAAIHAYVVEALSAAMLECVWRGHEYAKSALPHRLEIVATERSATTDRSKPPPRPQTRWRLQACTQFLDRERAPFAVLRLTWTKGELDRDSLLSSGWLIAREFVCNVQRLPARDGPPRSPGREDCPFTEGWMDEVAFGLFNTRVVSESTWTPSATPVPHDDEKEWVRANLGELARVAAEYRRDRFGTASNGKRHLFARQWELGGQAARVLARFLASCTSYEGEAKRHHAAQVQLVSLSFRIQGAASSPEELRRVVNACLLAGQSGLSFMKPPEKARLLQLLTQPIPDLAVWIYKVEALCRTFPV